MFLADDCFSHGYFFIHFALLLIFHMKEIANSKSYSFRFDLLILCTQQKFDRRYLICPVAVWIVVKLAQDLEILERRIL